jgi:laminin, alpha 1/2
MTCDLNDGGEAFRVVTKSSSKFSLCDNKWHNISALYDTHQIAIRIDDHPFLATNALTRVDENLRTYSQLYLGGLPGEINLNLNFIKFIYHLINRFC